MFFGPYHNGIARDIGRIDITAEEMGDYNYWQKQNLTVEQKKYLAQRIMAPISEEELSTLMGEFEQHEMTMKGLDGEFNGFTGRVSTKKGSSGVPEPSDHPGTTGSPSAAAKGTTTTDKPATSKTKTFVKKSKDVIVKAFSDYYKESQVIRFQPWGNLGKNKPKESGNASGGKTSSNAGNKSSDGAGTSSSSNGKKPNQTPSSSKKSQSSGETDATASSPGTGKKSGDGEGTNSPSSGKKTGQTPSTSKKSKSSGETDATASSPGTGKKPGDGEGTESSGSGKIEDPTPNTSKKTQTSGEPDTAGSNTGTGKKSSEGEGTSSSSANKKDNQIPNSHNQWKQDSSKKKGKDDKKKKEEEKRKREEEERQESESEAEGTGQAVIPPPIVYETVKYGDHFTRKNRKKVLKPNIEYTSPDGYNYRTDSQGRIIECEGALVLGKGDRSEYAQRTVGKGQGRLPDDDGGHLIGAQFKGPKDIDNLVPQNSQINRSGGKWYEMETEWANALNEVPPKKVTVKIEPVYSGSSMRPHSFEVTYQIGKKKEVTITIQNQPGG
ncbi:DNA/RNA non-specific endonuclease [Paenibacillus xylanexedens]|nr:DNA/RNA non-specific endonuclease [Paenibacillus xylanexedens]